MLPTFTLGTAYFVVTAELNSQIAVVSPDNDVLVEVTLSTAAPVTVSIEGATYNRGSTFTVVLDIYQTLQVPDLSQYLF